ncbi:helix-turn-helix domain-containing protein [Flavobacterium sp. Fl-77]|uniref:Helix-turn-helix domain-containing protein n=1 Tax=Flavobacterium flavipigmentatum TaxID=2893884 RepID=A0AAJ2VZN5_9FLAO|nr:MULTISPECIES: helix-turn-helix domain-containing protein [unclassified Flavobacterium]MDX6183920.1 helix-turn-helix domain-containing protein [Flavobacterium sp. Fl-33]MDX6187514.1 helix-turn-helix domain-containing protein [Flavobacterium sp. Fl-77]UFH37648.1 helix-turn-helix domain-containing protein [Flavobacterium sp. F-70]
MALPHQIKSIGEYHSFMDLPQPKHPLVSVVKFEDIKPKRSVERPKSILNGFYSIAVKKTFNAKMKYGQQSYDFTEGILAFIAPNQIISIVIDESQSIEHSGWLLIFHPDFLWNTPLAKKIKQYDFFGYDLNEALHLSEKEEAILTAIIQNINQEYNSAIDKFSQDVIIAQLELLLTYSERFYQRQFITRKITNHTILDKLENLLTVYFNQNNLPEKGLPTVQYISAELNISPNYLSRLLKTLTGRSTQQFIQDKLIDLAKEKLSTTDLSVNEIAYEMGFEHPQSFSKMFKTKTNLTPIQFRNSFN